MGGINSNVVLMLHGDGANGGSVFIDSARGHLVTKRNSVAIYASTAKLGTGGFFFSFNSLNEQTISIAHSIDFCFPTDDFTWDLYVWASGIPSMGMPILIKKLQGAYDGYALTVNPGHGRLVVNFAHQTGNSYGSWLYSLAAPTSFAISCWNHIAVTRAGSVIRMFSNGSIVVSQTGISTLHSGTDWVRIGQQNSNAYAWGRMDEIRLVKGVAVWTEDFVPPTEQYTWDIPISTITISESSETKAELTYDPDYIDYPTHEFSAIDNPSVIYLTGNALEGKSTTYSCVGAEGSLVMFATALSGELRVGSILASLPAITALVECGGDVNVNLPAISAELYGTVIKEASINTTLSAITAGLSGSQARIGYINKNLPSLLCAMSGTIPKVATINVNVPRISANIIGNSHKGLSMDLILPRLTATLTGYRSLSGSINSSLPSIGPDLVSESGLYETVVVNMSNKAMSKFINYNFNSLMEFNGEYLGIGRDGIYSLTGADDGGTDIQIDVKTAMIDLESETPYRTDMLQRMRHAWLGYKSNGDLAITVITDDGVEYEYTVDNITTNYGGRKVKFGKGLKDRYIQLELKNVGSATIQLDELRLFTEPVSHRKR